MKNETTKSEIRQQQISTIVDCIIENIGGFDEFFEFTEKEAINYIEDTLECVSFEVLPDVTAEVVFKEMGW